MEVVASTGLRNCYCCMAITPYPEDAVHAFGKENFTLMFPIQPALHSLEMHQAWIFFPGEPRSPDSSLRKNTEHHSSEVARNAFVPIAIGIFLFLFPA